MIIDYDSSQTYIFSVLNGFTFFCRYIRLETDVGALLWQTLGTIECRFIKLPLTDYWKINNIRVIMTKTTWFLAEFFLNRKSLCPKNLSGLGGKNPLSSFWRVPLVWLINDIYGVFAGVKNWRQSGGHTWGEAKMDSMKILIYEESKLESLMGILDRMTPLKVQIMVWWVWHS